VNAAFERFWHAVDAAKFARFGSLAAVLSYLKMCVQTTVLDHARAQRQHALEVDLTAIQAVPATDSVEQDVGDRLEAADLWRRVRDALPTEAERRLVYLSYVVGLSPREIQHRHGREFSRIEEIYRLKRSALDHLRHSPAFHLVITAQTREGG
jgi:DNA-directed RNA polymerase specialized sigma24 family protein